VGVDNPVMGTGRAFLAFPSIGRNEFFVFGGLHQTLSHIILLLKILLALMGKWDVSIQVEVLLHEVSELLLRKYA
jgi:hypothetical protein